jgi:hypothetical protein
MGLLARLLCTIFVHRNDTAFLTALMRLADLVPLALTKCVLEWLNSQFALNADHILQLSQGPASYHAAHI